MYSGMPRALGVLGAQQTRGASGLLGPPSEPRQLRQLRGVWRRQGEATAEAKWEEPSPPEASRIAGGQKTPKTARALGAVGPKSPRGGVGMPRMLLGRLLALVAPKVLKGSRISRDLGEGPGLPRVLGTPLGSQIHQILGALGALEGPEVPRDLGVGPTIPKVLGAHGALLGTKNPKNLGAPRSLEGSRSRTPRSRRWMGRRGPPRTAPRSLGR